MSVLSWPLRGAVVQLWFATFFLSSDENGGQIKESCMHAWWCCAEILSPMSHNYCTERSVTRGRLIASFPCLFNTIWWLNVKGHLQSVCVRHHLFKSVRSQMVTSHKIHSLTKRLMCFFFLHIISAIVIPWQNFFFLAFRWLRLNDDYGSKDMKGTSGISSMHGQMQPGCSLFMTSMCVSHK